MDEKELKGLMFAVYEARNLAVEASADIKVFSNGGDDRHLEDALDRLNRLCERLDILIDRTK